MINKKLIPCARYRKGTFKPVKLAVALLLTTVLCLPGAGTLADAISPALVVAPKDEVIYVNLTNDGKVDSAYAVNSFDITYDGELEDYGNFKSVSNLTTTDAMEYKNGKVSVHAPKGKFYYQGNLQSTELPWLVGVSYRLNGTAISAEDLAGKNGAFAMEISLRKNPKADESFFENYALQVSITLDAARCSNIVADGATAANAGATKILNYTVLPGTEKTIKVSADVKMFSMAGLQISGIPLSMDIELPDTSSLTDQFTDLQDGVKKLNDGAVKLKNGVSDLYNGANALTSGAQSLCDGAGGIANGANGLVTGAGGLRDGSAKLLTGSDTFVTGLASLDTNGATIKSGSAAIAAGLSTLATQLSSGGAAPDLTQLVAGSAQIKTGLEGLNTNITALSADNSAVAAAIAALAASTDTNVQTLIGAYNGLLGGAKTLATDVGTLSTSYAAIDKGINDIAIATGTSAGAMAALAKAVTDLSTQYTQFDQGLQGYVGGVHGLNTGYADLHSGIKALSDGTGAYLGGVQQFAGGASGLYDGAKSLVGGSGSLANGVNELKKGTATLASGTGEFKAQTSDIDTKVNDEIDKMLADFRNEDFVPSSFLSPKNNTIASVQFVMKTPGIAQPEKANAEKAAATELSPWDKLLDLFKSKSA
ncbi:MAG: hypothetical protein RSC01_02710 [Oscillospiraceae bacterium]